MPVALRLSLAWLLLLCCLISEKRAQPTPPTAPTSIPILKTTAKPSVKVTPKPPLTKLPTGSPTHQPSARPSLRPSAQPTHQPSSQPTSRPSERPSTRPSGQPTSQPMSRPSNQPTARPSKQPTGQPSSRPTVQPTKADLSRQFVCNQPQNCERNINGTCSFFSEEIVITCSPYTSRCLFAAKEIIVAANVHVNVSGHCQLTLQSHSFYMGPGSLLHASAVLVNATGNVEINGIIDVTGRTAAASVVPPTRAPTSKPVQRRLIAPRRLPAVPTVMRITPSIAPSPSLSSAPSLPPMPSCLPTQAPSVRTSKPTASNKDIINTRTITPTSRPLIVVPALGLGTPMEASWGGAYGGSGGRLAQSSGATIQVIINPPTAQPTLPAAPTAPHTASPFAFTGSPTRMPVRSRVPTAGPSFAPSFVVTAAPTLEADSVCSPFVNVDTMVGGVSLQADILALRDNDYTTATGSNGGGGVGSGRGGGRIAVFALSINITSFAQLLADGSPPVMPQSIPNYPTLRPTLFPSSAAPTNGTTGAPKSPTGAPFVSTHSPSPRPTSGKPTVHPTRQTEPIPVTIKVPNKGSGSGGAIALTARKFYGCGWLSVQGGNRSPLGAAGGGGRISIQILSGQQQLGYQVRIHGGLVRPPIQPTTSPTPTPTFFVSPGNKTHGNTTTHRATTTSFYDWFSDMEYRPSSREQAASLGFVSLDNALRGDVDSFSQGGRSSRRLQGDDDGNVRQGLCGSGLPCCAAGGAGTLYIQYGTPSTSKLAASKRRYGAYREEGGERDTSERRRSLKDVLPVLPPGVLYVSNHGHLTSAATFIDTAMDATVYTPQLVLQTPSAKLSEEERERESARRTREQARASRRRLDTVYKTKGSALQGIVIVDGALVAVGSIIAASSPASRAASANPHTGTRLACPAVSTSFRLRRNGVDSGVYSKASAVGGSVGQGIDFSCSFIDVEDASLVFFLSKKGAPTSSPTELPSLEPSAAPSLRPKTVRPVAKSSSAPTVVSSQSAPPVKKVSRGRVLAAAGGSYGAALSVDSLHLHSGSNIADSGGPLGALIVSSYIFAGRGSRIAVGHQLTIQTQVMVNNGTIVQPVSVWSKRPSSRVYITRPGGVASGQGGIVTLGNTSVASALVVEMDTIVLQPRAVISLPPGVAGSCWNAVPQSQFNCNKGAYSGAPELLSNGTVVLAGSTSVVLMSSSSIQVPALLLCGSTVDISYGSAATSDGCGCAPNSGRGTGHPPRAQLFAGTHSSDVNEGTECIAGGSGGAYGGFGGRSASRPPGRETPGGDSYFQTFRQQIPTSQANRLPGPGAGGQRRRLLEDGLWEDAQWGLPREMRSTPVVAPRPTALPTQAPVGEVDSRGLAIVHIYYSGSGGGLGFGQPNTLSVFNATPTSSPSSSNDLPDTPGLTASAEAAYLASGVTLEAITLSSSGGNSGFAQYKPLASSGGGMVVVQADTMAILNGLISSNGAQGSSWGLSLPSYGGALLNSGLGATNSLGNGGGSGGMVVINAFSINGNGTLMANGGAGGGASTLGGGGGGGGGGVVGFFNPKAQYVSPFEQPLFNFTGSILLAGGAGGHSPNKLYAIHPWHPTVSPTRGPTTRPTNRAPSVSAGLGVNETLFSAAFVNATSGSNGEVSWPHCLEGYGNVYAPGDIDGGFIVTLLCNSCPLGTYGVGGQGLCEPCNVIPAGARSFYASDRQANAQCTCACESLFPVLEQGASCQAGLTDVCLTAFGYFMYIAFGGVYQFACTVAGIAIFFALIVWRRRLQRLFEKEEKIVFKKVFYGKNIGFDEYSVDSSDGALPGRANERESISRSSMYITGVGGIASVGSRANAEKSTISPLYFGYNFNSSGTRPRASTRSPRRLPNAAASGSMKGFVRDSVSDPEGGMPYNYNFGYGRHRERESMDMKYVPDPRVMLRLNDADLPHHACRIYLNGSNHPLSSRGGAWQLPLSLPTTLRPLIDKREWRRMAIECNTALSWDLCSLEVLCYALTCLVLPPFGPAVLARMRHRRTQALLGFVNNYSHSCFKPASLKDRRSSLRIGISPDSTLAYLDVLFDEEDLGEGSVYRPLGHLGQVKLPLVFRLAGYGSYFSPWYLDTNDILLQAVNQSNVPTHFIDEAWIHFVVALNIRLKALQRVGLRHSLMGLMTFLEGVNKDTTLGGLVIELCTVCNSDADWVQAVKQAHERFIAQWARERAARQAKLEAMLHSLIEKPLSPRQGQNNGKIELTATANPAASGSTSSAIAQSDSPADKDKDGEESELDLGYVSRMRAASRFDGANPMQSSHSSKSSRPLQARIRLADGNSSASSSDTASSAGALQPSDSTTGSNVMQSVLQASRVISLTPKRTSTVTMASKGAEKSLDSVVERSSVNAEDSPDGEVTGVELSTLPAARGKDVGTDTIPPAIATTRAVPGESTAPKSAAPSQAASDKASNQVPSEAKATHLACFDNPLFRVLPLSVQSLLLSLSHQAPEDPADLDAYMKDYAQVCDLVLSGHLQLAIRVTHPRCSDAVTVFSSHEYSTEDERDDAEFGTSIASRVGKAYPGALSTPYASAPGTPAAANNFGVSAGAGSPYKSSQGGSFTGAGSSMYGDKAKTLEKYYSIVSNAESGLKKSNTPSGAACVSIGGAGSTTITATSAQDSGTITITIARGERSLSPAPARVTAGDSGTIPQTPLEGSLRMPVTPASGVGTDGRPVLIPGAGWRGLVDTFPSGGRQSAGDFVSRLDYPNSPSLDGTPRTSSDPPPPPSDQSSPASAGSPISPHTPARGKRSSVRKSISQPSAPRELGDNTYTGFRAHRDRRRVIDFQDSDNGVAGLDRHGSDESLDEMASDAGSSASANASAAIASAASRKLVSKKLRKRPPSHRTAKFSQYARPDTDSALLSSSAAQQAVNVWRLVTTNVTLAEGGRVSGGSNVGVGISAIGGKNIGRAWGSLEDGDNAPETPSTATLVRRAVYAVVLAIAAALWAALYALYRALAWVSFKLFKWCYRKITKRRDDPPGCPEAVVVAAQAVYAYMLRLSVLLSQLWSQASAMLSPAQRVVVSDAGCRDGSGQTLSTPSLTSVIAAGVGATSANGRPSGGGGLRPSGHRPSLLDRRDSMVAGSNGSIAQAHSHLAAMYRDFVHSYLTYALVALLTGANVVPLGGRVVRRLIRACLLCLSTMDIGLVVLLFIFGKVYFCKAAVLSQGAARCDAQADPALEYIMCVFPGAFALAPLLGTIAGLSELKAASSVRVYAGWSRLAMINTLIALATYFHYRTPLTQQTLGWIVGLLVGSRTIQCLLVDQYAGHIERMRWTRGWDGLVTSLQVTQDNNADLIY